MEHPSGVCCVCGKPAVYEAVPPSEAPTSDIPPLEEGLRGAHCARI